MTQTLPPALDDYANARAEAATVRTSLSAVSARDVRIEQVIQGQPHVVEQARKRGFYDFMLGQPSLARAMGRGSKCPMTGDSVWVPCSALASTAVPGTRQKRAGPVGAGPGGSTERAIRDRRDGAQ